MKFLLCFVSLIILYIIPNTYSQNSSKVPGSVGCSFFGTTPTACGELIPAACLPSECESLFFYDIHTDNTLKIIDTTLDNVKNRAFIDDLDSIGKPVYLYYGRTTLEEWMQVLQCISQDGGVNLKTEMTNLKIYLDQFKNIAGLVLHQLTVNPETQVIPDMTTKFKTYLDEIKKTLPNYSFGMEIIGRQLIDLYKNSTPPEWLDFQVLDPCIDFYILDLYNFNDCTPDLKVGGTSPISGNKSRTLDQLVAAAKKSGIPQCKTFFGFRSGGIPIELGDICRETNEELCKKKSLDGFCADNTKSYYDKGLFTKQNGVGFVMSNMDVADDPKGVCQCGTPYPAFHDVLAGFKCLPIPKPCPLLDKY